MAQLHRTFLRHHLSPAFAGSSMTRHHARLIATVSALALSALAVSDPSVVSADSGPATTNVIVVAKPGRLSIAEHTFKSLGGHIDRELQIIGGFAGALASNQIDALRSGGAVDGVSPDASVAPSSVDPALGYDPAETSSMSSITQIVGAQKMWNAGFTGAGVDVAVIDTGVARVPGLNATGKVIDGPDLSFDSLEPTLVYTDAFGHGTHTWPVLSLVPT